MLVEVFGCRHAETIPTLRRPASEKRQGTKSREVEHRRGRGRYGDLMLSAHSGMELMSAECGRRICILRPETGDGRLGKSWEPINELRVRRARRLRREGLLPAWGQRVGTGKWRRSQDVWVMMCRSCSASGASSARSRARRSRSRSCGRHSADKGNAAQVVFLWRYPAAVACRRQAGRH